MEQYIEEFVAILILGFLVWLGTRAEIAWRKCRAKKTGVEPPVVSARLALSKRWQVALGIFIIALCVATFLYGLYS